MDYIIQNGLLYFISFDHDLGLEESRFDCAKWLVNYCLHNQVKLLSFTVHSPNPVGKKNIESLLMNFMNNLPNSHLTRLNVFVEIIRFEE